MLLHLGLFYNLALDLCVFPSFINSWIDQVFNNCLPLYPLLPPSLHFSLPSFKQLFFISKINVCNILKYKIIQHFLSCLKK